MTETKLVFEPGVGKSVLILSGLLTGERATITRILGFESGGKVEIEVALEIAGKQTFVRYPPTELQLMGDEAYPSR